MRSSATSAKPSCPGPTRSYHSRCNPGSDSQRRSMFRTRLALVTLLAAALVVVASASAATPTLTGVDGPGFTISLKKGTAKATSLKAGKYKIVIKDLSNIHNFHLTGPGLNKKTSVGAKGTFNW